MAEQAARLITGCVLAGGEGRRMGGQDKGLLAYRGSSVLSEVMASATARSTHAMPTARPLASWVLHALAPQVGALMVSANRHADAYAALLDEAVATSAMVAPVGVFPDDPDLPPASGPLAGIVTALRHCPSEWLLTAPCDTPHLPVDLVQRLFDAAVAAGADIAVPRTHSEDGEIRHHWVCALVRKRVCPQTEALFVKGERKAGLWVRSLNWVGVSFAQEVAFTNMNTLETLHGRG